MEMFALVCALAAILTEAAGAGWLSTAFAFLTIIAILYCHITNSKEDSKDA